MADATADRTKFGVAVLAIVAATGMRALDLIEPAGWVSTVTWTVSAYIVGQIGAVLASGWTVAKLTDVRQKAAQ